MSFTNGPDNSTFFAAVSEEAETNTSLLTQDRILKIIYIIIGTIGMTGNGFVVLVICNYKKMLNQVTNIYIVNQSVIDGIAALMLIFSYIFDDVGNRKLEGVLDEMLCRMWLTRGPLWGFLVSSSANLVALTIERYIAVVYPIWHKNKFTRKLAIFTLPITWLVGPLVNGIYSVPSTRMIDGTCYVFYVWPNDTTRRGMGVYLVIFHCMLPISIFIYCYGKMMLTLRTQVGDGAAQKGASNFKAQASANILKTLVIVVAAFIICWGPNQIYFFLFNIGLNYPYIDFTSTIYHFSVVLTFLNCTINPIVYAIKYKQFQAGVRKLFKIKEPDPSGGSSAASGKTGTTETE